MGDVAGEAGAIVGLAWGWGTGCEPLFSGVVAPPRVDGGEGTVTGSGGVGEGVALGVDDVGCTGSVSDPDAGCMSCLNLSCSCLCFSMQYSMEICCVLQRHCSVSRWRLVVIVRCRMTSYGFLAIVIFVTGNYCGIKIGIVKTKLMV